MFCLLLELGGGDQLYRECLAGRGRNVSLCILFNGMHVEIPV